MLSNPFSPSLSHLMGWYSIDIQKKENTDENALDEKRVKEEGVGEEELYRATKGREGLRPKRSKVTYADERRNERGRRQMRIKSRQKLL